VNDVPASDLFKLPTINDLSGKSRAIKNLVVRELYTEHDRCVQLKDLDMLLIALQSFSTATSLSAGFRGVVGNSSKTIEGTIVQYVRRFVLVRRFGRVVLVLHSVLGL
jgi:hypothetical protein